MPKRSQTHGSVVQQPVWQLLVRGSLFLIVFLMVGCASIPQFTGPADDPVASLLAPPAWPASATQDAPTFDTAALARAIHAEVNAVRLEHDLLPLEWAGRLAEVALAHSRDMADHAFFGHTNLRGQAPGDRARQAGLPVQVKVGSTIIEGVGENLLLTHSFSSYSIIPQSNGQQTYVFEWKTPKEIAHEAITLWMNSPTHRTNLLSPLYQVAAVGIVHGANETLYITHNFSCQAAEILTAR